ncbi:M3 family oligoendopeptidase [Bacillus sp. BGMRC 2118]|nr:M3 family oligoendopeptidase [Bacillus sp. BGMRC 2118]
MLNFERLKSITIPKKWQIAYSEEIHKLDLLYQEEERLYYEMYTTGKQSSRVDEISQVKHSLMTDDELYQTLVSWRANFIDNHVWKRRLDVFLNRMQQESLDSHPDIVALQQQLQSRLLESQITVRGKEYNLGTVHSTIMDHSDRELRRLLFLESKKIGLHAEDLFRSLIKKRNQLAQDKGYQNYYDFICKLKDIHLDSYIKEMNELINQSTQTSNYWDKTIKEKFNWEKIHHYDQYFSTFHFHSINNDIFQTTRLEEILDDIVQGLGITIKDLPVTIEQLEIPYGGFCVNINPNDLRLVVNKRKSYSLFLSGIHEMGHVVDGHYSSYRYPELYRFHSSIAAEAIAELFQTIMTDQDFLKNNFHIEDEVYTQIKDIHELTDLKLVKINYFYSLVEYNLYNDPEKSFQELADECYVQVYGYEAETFHPASEMFYIENPVFFQDYNFALAIREMVRDKFNIENLYREENVFQELIQTIIEPNQLYSWRERVQLLCGEPHTFKYLAKNIQKRNI